MKVTEAQLRAMTTKRAGTRNATPSGARTVAKAPISPPTYRSKLEAAYATYLHGLKLAGDIQQIRYEHVRMKIDKDTTYCPDFWVQLRDGTEQFHEVKPHTTRILSREGRLKVRMAAIQWPSWKFVEVERVRGTWTMKEL